MLNLHLHLMVVHFPQAFTVTVLALALSPLIFRGSARALLEDTLKILSLLLLPAAAAAFGAGVIDGRLRFKRLRRSPILLRKLILASLLFLASLGLALLLWFGHGADSANVPVIVLGLIAAGCSIGLGRLGMQISTSEMPGG